MSRTARLLFPSLVAAMLALPTGCITVSTAPSAPQPQTVPVSVAATPMATPAAPASAAAGHTTGVITGVALAPPGIVAAVLPVGAGHVLPVGGGNFIGNNGGNVLPVGSGHLFTRGLLALAQQPLANAQVLLADAAGQPYPSLDPVTTDDQGRFTFPAVPAGYTLMVLVRAHDSTRDKDVPLQTLVRSSELGASTSVDAATTLVTTAVAQGQGGALGELNTATFRAAADATASHLADADLPDLSDRDAILGKIDSLAASVAELKTELDEIKSDLRDIKNSLDKIETDLASQQRQPSPTPMPQGPGGYPQGPGGQMPPPPGGMGPGGPGPGPRVPGQPGPPGCGVWTTFHVTLNGPYSGYPLQVRYVGLGGGRPVIASATVSGPGVAFTVTVPANCPHGVELYDGTGHLLASKDTDALVGDGSAPQVLSF